MRRRMRKQIPKMTATMVRGKEIRNSNDHSTVINCLTFYQIVKCTTKAIIYVYYMKSSEIHAMLPNPDF